MKSAPQFLREIASRPQQRHESLTSWYMQGTADGLGDRLLMYDNSGGPSLELLRFRHELAVAPGFERELRARVERLEQFQHQAFPGVQAVEHLEQGGELALVSTYTAGKRLSEMLRGPKLTSLEPAFAISLIRQLTPALAQLQRQGDGVTHGLLCAERVVLTPEGSLVMREHVVGAAVASLRLKPAHLWNDFGVITAADEDGAARFDRRTDVVQLGLLALSVLLGRVVTPEEYPSRLGFLLDEFSESASHRSTSAVAALYLWLDRALRSSEHMFRSAEEAQAGLRELTQHGPASAIEHTAPVSTSLPRAALRPQSPALVEKGPEPETESPRTNAAAPGDRRTAALAWSVAAAFALLTIVEGVVIARSLNSRPPVLPANPVPLVIESPQIGDVVMVDGRQAGARPLQLSVGSTPHSIRVVKQPNTGSTEPAAAIASGRPAPVDAKTEAALAQAAARQRPGGLRLTSPIELKVLEGEHVLGSSTDGPIVTTAGVHELDFINTTIGFRSHQSVTIRPGQIASLEVTPPDGRLSINAAPWAQVWIDGAAAGETPLGNISVQPGEHEIVFRHPQLGERRETILVRAGAMARVSATLSR